MDRYVVVQEPSGSWAVFDALLDAPAEIGGKTRIGLSRDEAKRIAETENLRRREAASGRVTRLR